MEMSHSLVTTLPLRLATLKASYHCKWPAVQKQLNKLLLMKVNQTFQEENSLNIVPNFKAKILINKTWLEYSFHHEKDF
jgi:hypothetical protein